MKLLALLFALISVAQVALADDLLTGEEIDQSSLSETEKGLAAASLMNDPVVTCWSANEAGAQTEQLRIYYFEIGNVFKASSAVYKTLSQLKVFGSFATAADLQDAYKQNATLALGTEASQLTGSELKVSFGHEVPMVGKVAKVEIAGQPATDLICKLGK